MMFLQTVRAKLAQSLMALIAAAGIGGVVSTAEARDFQVVSITVDPSTGQFDAKLDVGEGQPPYQMTSAREIANGIFTKIDLKVALTNETRELIQKMLDQGFTSEPSGCTPGAYGPLDMEDGLRYFFEIGLSVGEKVNATIYPGNRSTHWTNDVFCEYDAEAGADKSIFRLTGFYYVIHRELPEDTIDVQLRPVTLSNEEVETYLATPAQ